MAEFDPNKPFEVVDEPQFDPSQPFEVDEEVTPSPFLGALQKLSPRARGPGSVAELPQRIGQFLTQTPVLPIAGGVAGELASLPAAGAAAVAFGPAAGLGVRAAASGLGEAGGEAFRQIGQQVLGAPEAPTTPGEAAQRIGGAFAIGAAAPPAAAGVTRVLRAAGRAITPTLTEGITATRRIIKKFGGDLTIGQLTENKFIDFLENVARGSITGGGIIATAARGTQAAVNKLKDTVLSKLGKQSTKFLTQEELGEVLSNHIIAGRNAFNAIAGTLYDTVDRQVGQALVSPQRIISSITDFVSEKSRGLTNPIVDAVVLDLRRIIGPTQKSLSFVNAATLRSRLLQRSRDLGTELGAKEAKVWLGRFARSVDESLEQAGNAVNPQAQKLWRVANKFFKQNIETFENEFVEKLVSESKDIVPLGRALTQVGNTKQIDAIMQAVKRASIVNKDLPFAKATQQINQGFLDNIFSRATDAQGKINFSSVLQNLRPNTSIGTTARQIFKPIEITRLNQMLQTAQQALTTPTGGAGAAGLAQITAAIGLPAAGFGAITGRPGPLLFGLGIIFAPRVIARAVTSPTLTRLVISGARSAAKEGLTGKSVNALTRLLGEAVKD